MRNGNYYYWEIEVLDKAYGTSVMFGVCTKEQKLHVDDYCNLVGLDREGWSLSHKGLIWHSTKMSPYMDPFPANQPITLGILYNTARGELSYFMVCNHSGWMISLKLPSTQTNPCLLAT